MNAGETAGIETERSQVFRDACLIGGAGNIRQERGKRLLFDTAGLVTAFAGQQRRQIILDWQLNGLVEAQCAWAWTNLGRARDLLSLGENIRRNRS
ncbi:MAG: hypothetical protein ACRD8U_00460 [Pyrinomonadaceae bacterium]